MTGADADGWTLDPRLAADAVAVADGPLSVLLLHTACEVEWWILVPRVVGAVELCDLTDAAAAALHAESTALQRALLARHRGARLNVGKLGNVVAQLHLHHVVRRPDDALWPGPVWGRVGAARRSAADVAARTAALRAALPVVEPVVTWRWRAL